MLDKEILEMGDKLLNVVSDQKKKAQKSLSELPEGDTKRKLKALLNKASSGKLTMEDAQKAIKKIQDNAS